MMDKLCGENSSVVFVTKHFEKADGWYLYSEGMIENLRSECENLKVSRVKYSTLSFYSKLLFRIIFLCFLIPSIWIETILKSRTIYNDLSRKISSGTTHIFLDHMQYWWIILPLIFSKYNGKIILISHNLEYKARLSYFKYGTIFYKIAALLEVIHFFIWEVICTKLSDGIISINEKEKEFYASIIGSEATYLIYPNISRRVQIKANMLNEDSNTLSLIGSYAYKAKELNALWLINEVMPLLNKYEEKITLNVVGRHVTKKMEVAAKSQKNVKIIGEVRKLDKWYQMSFATIIPEMMGGGFKLKITEAIKFNKAIIIHKEAIKGTPYKHGKECLSFTTKKECVKCIMKVHTDNELRKCLIENSVNQLNEFHSAQKARKELRNVLVLKS